MDSKAEIPAQIREVMAETEIVMPELGTTELCPQCGERTALELSENEHGDALQRAVCRRGHWQEKYASKLDSVGGVGMLRIPSAAVEICRTYSATTC